MKWTEKDYRQKIRQMKEQISDEEMFLSERYQELLRKMSAQITKDHFRNVHTYRNDEPELAGWCDGNTIGINIENIMTQSFQNKELKNKSLVGILGHECGHKNFSNSYLREKYLKGILKEHKFYPHSPVPETEGEKESLESLKECFQCEVYTVIRLVYDAAAYLNNLLEDVYVEEKMCRWYPGSIRQGILMNRIRHSDLIISLKKQMEMGRARTEIMLNVITQYTLSGSVNDWEGVGQEYIECLDLCIPIINEAVSVEKESVRFEATNQILLKIWKFIKADVDDVEESRQNGQGKEAECNQQEPNSEEGLTAETPEPNQEKEPTDETSGPNREGGSTEEMPELNQEKGSTEETSEPNQEEEPVDELSESNPGEKSECSQSEPNPGEGAESGQLDQSQKEGAEGELTEQNQREKLEYSQQNQKEKLNQGEESECRNEQNRDQEPECEDSEQNREERPECEDLKQAEDSDCGGQKNPEAPEKGYKEQDSSDSMNSDHQEQSQENNSEDGLPEPNQEKKSDESFAGQSEQQPGNSKALTSEQSEGSADNGSERIEQLIDELLSQLSSYSGDYISGQAGREAQDIPWDGTWNPEKQNEKENHAASENSSNETSKTSGDKAEEYKNPDSITVSERDFEEKAQVNQTETENEMDALIYGMAKEKVDMQFEEELQETLREQMNQIEFGTEHARVEKRLIRSAEISEEAVSCYKELEKQMRQVMKRLKIQVLPFLEKKQTRMEKGMQMGRRMDHRTLYRPDRKVFQRRSLPAEEQDTVMAVLIDLSGSMRLNDRINYAVIAALCLYQFGQEAGIPTAVYGHHTELSGNWKREIVCIHSFAEFDSMDGKDKYRIMDAKSCGANRDGVAVRYMGEKLLARPEKQKLLILISDGFPNGLNYCGITAKEDLRRIKVDLTSRGVIFLAAAIGDDKAAIQEIYEEAFLDISDLKKLPEKLAKQVLKKIS